MGRLSPQFSAYSMLKLNGMWLQRQGLQDLRKCSYHYPSRPWHLLSLLAIIARFSPEVIFVLSLYCHCPMNPFVATPYLSCISDLFAVFVLNFSIEILFQVTAYQEDFASEQKASAEKLLQLQNSLVKHQDWIKKLAAEVCPLIISMCISNPFSKF